MIILIFIGLPGSGKGTQASFLTKEKGFKAISAGDLLRKFLSKNTAEITAIKNKLPEGSLMPDSMVNEIIKNQIEDLNLNYPGIILDGYPRSINQAQYLDKNMFKNSKKLAISFDIQQELLLNRIKGRHNCSNCGKIYNDQFPTIITGQCDDCGGKEFFCRKDDNANTLKIRINEYNKNTAPVLEHYKKLNILHRIDAKEAIEKVSAHILRILDSSGT